MEEKQVTDAIESFMQETRDIEEKKKQVMGQPSLYDRIDSLEKQLNGLKKELMGQINPTLSGQVINPTGCSLRNTTAPTKYNEFQGFDAYDSILQGTWTYNLEAAQAYQFIFYNNSNVQNDEIKFRFSCERGSYTLLAMGKSSTNYAISSIYIDGGLAATIDWYNNPSTNNALKTATVLIRGDGNHTISFKAATRNASNKSGWYIGITWWALRKL